jgi:hypothetical protein
LKQILLHKNKKLPSTLRKGSEDYSTTTLTTAIPKQQNRAAAAFENKFSGPIGAAFTNFALPLVVLILAYWSYVDGVEFASLSASLGETTNT